MISEQEKIWETLLEKFKGHFSQADGTLFTMEPLAQLITKLNNNEYVNVNNIDTDEASKEITMYQLQQ